MPNLKRIQQLDLNLLRVFEQLYLEQNMTRAADELNITPSAVSHAIRRLRDVLDDPLFIRAQQKMVPTPACQRMAPAIIDTLKRLHHMLQQWGEFDPNTTEQTFRIGMHDAMEPAVLPALSALFARTAPKASLACVKIDRNNLAKELSAGHIDVALDAAVQVKPPICHHTLWTSEFCVVMRVDHPLRYQLTRAAYLEASHISVSNRPTGMTGEDSYFQQKGLHRRSTIRCQNYFAAATILKTSDQLLTTTRAMAQHLLDAELVLQDVPYPIPKLVTQLYWHETTEQDAALSWLRGLIVETTPPS